jgi:hypothetical protein
VRIARGPRRPIEEFVRLAIGSRDRPLPEMTGQVLHGLEALARSFESAVDEVMDVCLDRRDGIRNRSPDL